MNRLGFCFEEFGARKNLFVEVEILKIWLGINKADFNFSHENSEINEPQIS